MVSAWVDFKAVKQIVSMETAIARYGVMLRRIHAPYLRGRLSAPKSQVEDKHSQLYRQHREECLGLSFGFLCGVPRRSHRRQCTRFRG